jgi:Questin oxidase-like
MLPPALLQLLHEHSALYAPHYPPSDNADHGPMACLAMHGLGIELENIERFADRYRQRLVPKPRSRQPVNNDNWQQHIGQRGSYSALHAFFESEIDSSGWRSTVAHYLPSLLSGWVKDAFHPLIRLGYGIEFQVPEEIAAGLAYLAISGDDPALAAMARREPGHLTGPAYLEALQSMRDGAFVPGAFNSRYRRVCAAATLQPASETSGDAVKELSRACLEVFAATHEFFALHLVTSSHAFRICAPWAGPNAGALFSVGIAVAYLAIGAPRFESLPIVGAPLPLGALSTAIDEHDIKLAYSCLMQSRAYADPTYCWSAARYLTHL